MVSFRALQQETFVSSTFWTERIGPASALATLDIMERVESWKQITETGGEIRKLWDQLATRHGLCIDHWGIAALCGFTIQSHNALVYKTLITQEMLHKGFLAATSVYVCTEHTPEVLDAYSTALDDVFALIAACERSEEDVLAHLYGPVAHSGFKRLN